jgi:hypothetical protein
MVTHLQGGLSRGMLRQAWHPKTMLGAGRLEAYRMPKALSVGSSSSPVDRKPWAFWNQRRACCVCGPMAPSIVPGLNPTVCRRS